MRTVAIASSVGAAAAALSGNSPIRGGAGVVPNWTPTYNMSLSTIVQPCNSSGLMDPEWASNWGVVDFDWSNGKALWANAQPMNCEELLVTQAKLVADAAAKKGSGTRVFVYRNFVKALPWYTHVRQPLTNASTKDTWFLPFKPGGSLPGGKWHVPDCDNNYNPPLCSDRYHDQDQTPGHPHGDGSCTAPCDCGGVPCGEYLWDQRGPGLRDYFVDVLINGPTGLGAPFIHGFYLDDGWSNTSAAVAPWEPQPNGFCDHWAIGGATEEDYHCTEDMGLTQADTTAITDAWRANMAAVGAAIVAGGGFSWQQFVQQTIPPAGPTCAPWFRKACAPGSEQQTAALMLEYTNASTSSGALPAFEQDLAGFLLVRGPYAWLGAGWIGCNKEYDPRMTGFGGVDYGEPTELCAETAPGSGVFTRDWTKASVQFDCNTWTGSVTPK